jgi:chorismate dehydratase
MTATWTRTIGRVAFINCDPLFTGLDDSWSVLAAPPSWLTGHVLRRDCVLAPIPAADYARHHEDLVLVPDVGISSAGEVGSVLLFGDAPIEQMKTIAIPSDSASSVALLRWLVSQFNHDVTYVQMGPDLAGMLDVADGALVIGDRALDGAALHPNLVQMDLSQAWVERTGLPMVFGVFVARADTPKELVAEAHAALLQRLLAFEREPAARQAVLERAHAHTGLSMDRLDRYFGEVFNRLAPEDHVGLHAFLERACGLNQSPRWAWEAVAPMA